MPSETELRDFCNLGNAGECTRMPAERRADCVRFSVAKDNGARILLHFVWERDHAPVEWGILDYDAAAQEWNSAVSDLVLQRQAECYLGSYLERRPRAFAAAQL